MGLPGRITADVGAGLLLVGAAAVLLATPYDGGSCSNVAAAYALPAASLPDAEPPDEPSALAEAHRAVAAADADATGLESEQAEVDQLYEAAEEARAAANAAQEDLWESPYTVGYSSDSSMAELDVDFAESDVESAEDWLAYVQEEVTSDWAFYDEADVNAAQADLDEALADLADAQAALTKAQNEDTARESKAANAEASAEQLDASADAAEQAATDAAGDLYDRKSAAESRLSSARSRVAQLEADHEIALADWSHEQRVAADHVTALNNVRASCRDNGSWRAGVALLDVVLVAALALRRWTPRLPSRLRLPWRRQ
jgi:hypothetical protein